MRKCNAEVVGWTFLVQGLRVHLTSRRLQVQPPVQEETTSCRATKPRATGPGPAHHDSSPGARALQGDDLRGEPLTATERACLLWLEKRPRTATKTRRSHGRGHRMRSRSKPGLLLSTQCIRASVNNSGPEAKFPSPPKGGGRERGEMLFEEKEAATLVQIHPAGRGGLSETVRVRPAALPGTSPSRASARAGRGHAPPPPGSQKKERGPPLGPPVMTGGKEGQPRPALSYASRSVPIQTLWTPKLWPWASRFTSSGKLVTDFRSHSTPVYKSESHNFTMTYGYGPKITPPSKYYLLASDLRLLSLRKFKRKRKPVTPLTACVPRASPRHKRSTQGPEAATLSGPHSRPLDEPALQTGLRFLTLLCGLQTQSQLRNFQQILLQII